MIALLLLLALPLRAEDAPPQDPASAKAWFDQKLAQNPNDAKALAGRAAAFNALGDKTSACADAKAAAALAPDDDQIVAISRIACHEQVLKGKEYKAKPKKEMEQEADVADRKKLEAKDKPRKPGSPAPQAPGAPPQTTAPAPAADPNAPFESYERAKQAQEMLNSGRAVEGIAMLQDALRLDPNNVRARWALAAAYDARGDFAEALDEAKEGLKRRPGHPDLLRVLAHAQLKVKDPEGAKASADALLAQNPTDALAYALKAQALGQSGDREGMLALLEKAAAFDPAFGASLDEARAAAADADPPFRFPGEGRPRAAKKKDAAMEKVLARLMMAGTALALVLFALFLLRSRPQAAPEPAPQDPPQEPPAQS